MAPELLLGLLSSEHADVIGLTLSAVHDLACIVPNVIPIEAAPRLVQLLSDKHHGKQQVHHPGGTHKQCNDGGDIFMHQSFCEQHATAAQFGRCTHVYWRLPEIQEHSAQQGSR